MFEKVSRLKLRFQTTKGNISVEDLWDFSLAQLNTLAKKLNRELKSSEEEDFLQVKSQEDMVLKLKFNTVIYILNAKKEESEASTLKVKNKAEKQRLLELMKKKQDSALEELSEEELQKRIDAMG